MNARSARHLRRGNTTALVVISMPVAVGMAALVIDIGILSVARTELQVSADAAALAGAAELLNQDRLTGEAGLDGVMYSARVTASVFAGRNLVMGQGPSIDLNEDNSSNGGVVVGYLQDPTDPSFPMDLSDPDKFNAVHVRVHRNSSQNGSIALMFARLLGYDSADVGASATAAFEDGIVGYRLPDPDDRAMLFPFALHKDVWTDLLNSGVTVSNDNYAYDPETGEVTSGWDSIPELNLYPGFGAGQLPPGNFGTVDIGASNNSTADIARQIREGVNQNDLAYFGGELRLDESGTLLLNGDTGISAAIKDDLEAVTGESRAILLFSSVAGPGNNAYYTVTGFAGVRVMNVNLTGPMQHKRVIIQPAIVTDAAAIADSGNNTSYHVYCPVVLCR